MKVKRTDDLLVALDQMRQNEIEEGVGSIEPRNFFRGSEVGHCSNQINFRRRGTEVKERGVSNSRFLEDGHLHQAVLSGELKKAGIKVFGEEAESTEKIIHKGTTIKIKAHKDGTVVVDKEKMLLEVKSVKEEKFQEVLKTDDVSSYYDQIQVYMFLYDFENCRLVVVDRNNSLRLEYGIARDKERIKFLILKLVKVENDLKENKTSSRDHSRNSKECGWCPYYEKCWGVAKGRYTKGEATEKAVEIEGKKEEKAWTVAIDLYRKYLRLKKESTTHKEEADNLMEMLFAKFKATKIHGEGGSVSKSVGSKQIPDKGVIKELIIKGIIPVETKDTSSLRYNVGGGEEEGE